MSAPIGRTLPEGQSFLTAKETAALMRIGASTLERMRLEGTGPRYIKLGRNKRRGRVIYALADVLAWLDAQRCRSTSEYGPGSAA